MSDERKFARANISKCETPFGNGTVTGKFEAERFPGSDLLDTSVELEITPFAITWKDKEKLIEELAALIAKYQI
jgi:hypothetical protein